MLAAKQVLELISVAAAFLSGMTLFWAGLGVALNEASWKGQTPRELRIRCRQKTMMWIGIPAAIIAAAAQITVILKF